jgi:hypothetical protein
MQQHDSFDDQAVDSLRYLQESNNDSFRKGASNCFCPIGAIINSTKPTIDELQDLFTKNLALFGITFEILDFQEGIPLNEPTTSLSPQPSLVPTSSSNNVPKEKPNSPQNDSEDKPGKSTIRSNLMLEYLY